MTPPPKGVRRQSSKGALPPSRLAEIIADLPLPMVLADLSGFQILAVNAPLADLAGMGADELIGATALELASPEQRSAVEADRDAIADGRLEGFQAGRVFQLPNGATVRAKVWVRRIVVDGDPYVLAIVLPEDGTLYAEPLLVGGNVDLLLAVTDHDWVIEHVSADAYRVFGTGAGDLRGQPLLGTVHPDDAAGFAMWLTEAASSQKTLACRARLRAARRDWKEVTCYISALCAHSPPRLGLAVCRAADEPRAREHGQGRAPEQAVWRTAMEMRAAGLTSSPPKAIASGPPALAATLSSRQWEIVERLVEGQSVRTIASEMFLSPRTVRNHLVAIFRRFGVHSQLELVAAVRDRAMSWQP